MSPNLHASEGILMSAADKCDFCNEFGGGIDNAFSIRYAAEVRCRNAFETRAFAVLPTLGQIVPGYLLVVPKHHHLAIGDMSQDEIQELEELRAMLLAALGGSYGTYVFFEHWHTVKNFRRLRYQSCSFARGSVLSSRGSSRSAQGTVRIRPTAGIF